MAHIHEKYDFTVAAFIVYQSKILLIDHKTLKLWLPIGGHIELSEDPEEALFREIEEESGLKQTELKILTSKPNFTDSRTKILYNPNYLDVHNINDTHKHISFTYFLHAHTDRTVLAEGEHYEIKWWSLEELKNPEVNTTDAVRFYSREAIKLANS